MRPPGLWNNCAMSSAATVDGDRDDLTDIDLGNASINADPDAFAATVLAGDPIRRSERNRAWLLLSYKAATEGFLDPRLSSDRTGAFARQVARRGHAFERTYELLSGWMVFHDPPAHTRLREPVRRAFTPRVMERLREAVESTVEELLISLGDGGAVDLKEAFAAPLPAGHRRSVGRAPGRTGSVPGLVGSAG